DRITEADRDREWEGQPSFDVQNHDQAKVDAAHAMMQDARALWNNGSRNDAVAECRQALAASPDVSIALQLAEFYREDGNPTEALLAAGFAYGCNPRLTKASMLFAELLIESGDPRRAWWIVMEVLNREPDHGPARSLAERLENQA
ncbi:MAG: hypothetical protein AAFS11_07445, partial [Planctomycetota bacterium]